MLSTLLWQDLHLRREERRKEAAQRLLPARPALHGVAAADRRRDPPSAEGGRFDGDAGRKDCRLWGARQQAEVQ